jgi:excisionase family DNA binding protein
MELLSIKEAAELTRLSASFWRSKVFKREIKFLKIGSRVLIPRSTIDQLLNQSVVEPTTKSNDKEVPVM